MKKVKQSFTLVEILVVIVIIGILSSFIFFTVNDSVKKANLAKTKMFEEAIRNNLLMNLVAEWNFDELNTGEIPSGSIVLDSWGNNNGTSSGDITVKNESECVSGKCLNLDGDEDYITISTEDKTKFQVKNFTISSFINTKNPGIIFMHGEPVNRKNSGYVLYGWNFAIITSKGQKECRIELPENGWHLITATYNGLDMKVYIDDKEHNSTLDIDSDIVYNIGRGTSTFRIGEHSYVTGYATPLIIDNLRFYNAAIPESQIKQEYLTGLNNLYAKGLISAIEYNEKINDLAKK